MSEELTMQNQSNIEYDEAYIAYNNIPYFIIDEEIPEYKLGQYKTEFAEIIRLYDKFKKGCNFLTEGSNADYVPSTLRYKKSAMIIKKEARFLFANPVTFNVNVDDVQNNYKKENTIIQKFLDKVLDKNNFNGKIIKAVKDCFVGKRIAIVLNFNDDGINITFLNSLEFFYESSKEREGELTKFVTFYRMDDSEHSSEQKWFKKKYTKVKDVVYLEEYIYSGNGELLETVTKRTPIKLPYIPATVIINDGLTGDFRGESELQDLIDAEKYYSKLANADMDAERKSMNPIRYTIDASQKSTEKLSTSPGSYWDLQSDDDKPNENTSARVGTIEPQMNYSSPLKTTLDRIETQMYASVDVPNITSEQLSGIITSGKTIQALYWGLTVRCDEKMLSWGPSLKFMAVTIIEGAKLYPNSIKNYTRESSIPDIEYDIIVENNYPLPEDVKEEKELDIAEVEAKLMSRKAYQKKWRKLSDEEANSELQQIKLEQELLENAVISYNMGSTTGKRTNEFSDDSIDDSNNQDDNNGGETVNYKKSDIYNPSLD